MLAQTVILNQKNSPPHTHSLRFGLGCGNRVSALPTFAPRAPALWNPRRLLAPRYRVAVGRVRVVLGGLHRLKWRDVNPQRNRAAPLERSAHEPLPPRRPSGPLSRRASPPAPPACRCTHRPVCRHSRSEEAASAPKRTYRWRGQQVRHARTLKQRRGSSAADRPHPGQVPGLEVKTQVHATPSSSPSPGPPARERLDGVHSSPNSFAQSCAHVL